MEKVEDGEKKEKEFRSLEEVEEGGQEEKNFRRIFIHTIRSVR